MENPVTCKVTNVSVKQGKSICSWSSCQEGCTRERFQCYQVRVQYVDVDYKKGTTVDEFSESAWIKLSHFENIENVVITFRGWTFTIIILGAYSKVILLVLLSNFAQCTLPCAHVNPIAQTITQLVKNKIRFCNLNEPYFKFY